MAASENSIISILFWTFFVVGVDGVVWESLA